MLRVGEVTQVSGKTVIVRVDRRKNSSDLLFDGEVLRNISVNSYVEIRKGFMSLIGKVDGERLDEISERLDETEVRRTDRNRRYLQISLAGYLDQQGRFNGGLRELPLIGNEVFIVTKEKIEAIHDLVCGDRPAVRFAVTENEGFEIAFPIDGLFNSHISIFGNTGSGKSNTLAAMYASLVETLTARNAKAFRSNNHFLVLDFNGEYVGDACITSHKKVFALSTRTDAAKLPMKKGDLLDLEILSILADATEKTQKPFLRRTLRLYSHVFKEDADDPIEHFRNLLRQALRQTLQMSDKLRADLLLDYFSNVLPDRDAAGDLTDVRSGLDWNNKNAEFTFGGSYLKSNPEHIPSTPVYQLVADYDFKGDDVLSRIVDFLYYQLISDVLTNRAQNEHIAPAINKLISKKADIEKVLDFDSKSDFWESNFVVVSLNDVNLDMKKTIPLLLSKKLYDEHKAHKNNKSLTIIIDEAHNILSTESSREAENWKDYRLETFEEIIKEGRKFGVFVTISSQRPNDISPTIASQAHNYFIHRLVNQKDLAMISNAVSYIDKITEESIPTLPVGTCIFSGVAGQMPLKIRVRPLLDSVRPRSGTIELAQLVPPN